MEVSVAGKKAVVNVKYGGKIRYYFYIILIGLLFIFLDVAGPAAFSLIMNGV
jgi:hypothetical protein